LVKLKDYTDPFTKTNITQITYGRSQTTEFGNLSALIKAYVQAGGSFAAQLKPYSLKIGRQPSMANDILFCNLLRNAGKLDKVMQTAQDEFFDLYYYLPALGRFNQMGFTLPLSMLVIYDSFIHSGTIPTLLRQRFPEFPPVKGGDEKTWISQYVAVRHEWLATHKKAVLHPTIYRTKTFKAQIDADNWSLQKPVNANGITVN
jgi:chitosanase